MSELGYKLKCATNKCKRPVIWWYNLDHWCEKDYHRVRKLAKGKK